MITQLTPYIPVQVIEFEKTGTGECIAFLDYSQEHDLLWIVAFDDTGEVWQVPNKHIRFIKNVSIGRKL